MRRSTIVPALALLPLLIGCRKEPLPIIDASAPDAMTSDGASASFEGEDPPDPPLEPATRKGCEPACAADEKCVGIACVPANVGLTMTREHTCVLDRTGRVQCWGANKNGEVGDGTRTVRPRPVDVIGLTDAVQIVARDGATCARRRAGEVVCWGHLLDTDPGPLAPVSVLALRGAIDIALGRDFVCGVMPTGKVECLPDKKSPLRSGAGLVDDATAIAANGNELCALRRDREVTCWTKDRYNADGGTEDVHARMEGVTDVAALTSSGEAICAIAPTGRAKCWSDGGIALADGGIRPISVGGVHDFARLGPVVNLSFLGWGNDEDCAVEANGQTVCWSPPFISKRRLTARDRRPLVLTPKVVEAPPAVLIASTKYPRAHCILTRAGEVRCWGDAVGARVGSVRNPDQATPQAIDGVKGVRDVTASDQNACARLLGGAISCWGAGKIPHVVKAEGVDRLLSGQCASVKGAFTCFDRAFESALPDSGLRDIVEVAPSGGGTHILSYWARSANGQVSEVAWARSNDGLNRWTLTYARPTEIKSARALIAAGDVNCVREADSAATTLRCWPRLSEPPLKLTTITVPAGFEQLQLRGNRFNASFDGCGVNGGRIGCFDSKLEVKWLKLEGVKRYAKSPAGVSCALTNGGALYCWGDDDDDLTGHGTAGVKEPRVVPGLERGVAGFTFAQESFNHQDAVFAWMNDGRLLAWGHNGTDDERMGQLGWIAPAVIKEPQKIER